MEGASRALKGVIILFVLLQAFLHYCGTFEESPWSFLYLTICIGCLVRLTSSLDSLLSAQHGVNLAVAGQSSSVPSSTVAPLRPNQTAEPSATPESRRPGPRCSTPRKSILKRTPDALPHGHRGEALIVRNNIRLNPEGGLELIPKPESDAPSGSPEEETQEERFVLDPQGGL